MLFFILPYRFREKLNLEGSRLLLLELLLRILLLCLLYTIGFKYIERVSWEEAAWQVWQTVTTVGYGNRPAATTAGRWVTMFFGIIGIGLLGQAISAYFEYRGDMRSKRRFGYMDNQDKNGYVIIHFPGESALLKLIAELRHVERDVPVCLVDNEIEELPQSVAVLPDVHFVRGSDIARATYERAGLQDSKTVIVFPDRENDVQADAQTKVVIDLVEKFIDPSATVIAAIVDEANEWLFEGSRASIVHGRIEILTMVQECQDRFSAAIVQDLFSNTGGTNPQTVRPVRIVGWTWGELVQHSVPAVRQLGQAVNPFAIVQNGAPNSCPGPDTAIAEGDYLSIIADSAFDWDQFEQTLVHCRNSGSSR